MSDLPPPGPEDTERKETPPPRAGEPLWIRALYMLLFAVIGYFLLLVFFAVCVLQLIVIAVSEKPNSELKELLRNILAYIGVTLAYLALLDEQKPFPFSPFPYTARD